MSFTKARKAVPLMLIAGILISVGSQNTEVVATQVNRFIERQDSKTMFASQDLTKEQAKEETIKLFEKYFDEKIDTENLFENTRLFKRADEYNFEEKDYWQISWSTFDYNRLGNMQGMTNKEIDQLNEDRIHATSYDALLEEKTGQIIEIGKIDGQRDGNFTIKQLREKEIKTEEAKNIALNYIKKNKLVNNIEDLEFLGEIRLTPEFCAIAYKYGGDKVVNVYVDSLSKKVSGFRYENEPKVKEGIENNKNYKTDGVVG